MGLSLGHKKPSGSGIRKNSSKITKPAKGTEQTVGIRAKVRKPGNSSSVGNSTSHKVNLNHFAIHPSIAPTVGLKGAKVSGLKGTAKSTNISRGSTSKGSKNSHVPNGQSSTTVGLRGAKVSGLKSKASTLQKSPTLGNTKGLKGTKSANRGGIKSTGTIGKVKAGGKGIPFKGGRRTVASSVPGAGSIPAAVRRAASRHSSPSNPGLGKSLNNPVNSKITLQNSSYKQQVRG